MDKYVCNPCGWVYDPAVGDPENGVEAGTAFENLSDDWVCPLCGAGKEDFSKMQNIGNVKKRLVEIRFY